MAFKNWKEYIDERGKVVEKAKVEKIADYNGTPPSDVIKSGENPNKENPKVEKDMPELKVGKLEKDVKSVFDKGAGAEYSSKYSNGSNATPKKIEGEGLAEKGDKKNIYNIPEDGKSSEQPTWPKTKTESFLEKTSKMSMKEFVQHMTNECGMIEYEDGEELPHVTAYSAGKFHPHPPEAINYIAALATKNDRIMDGLIHEIKRQDGGLEKLIKAIFEHPETSNTVVSMMDNDEDGPSMAKNLVHSMDNHYNDFLDKQNDMYESVAPPFGVNDDEDEEATDSNDEENSDGSEENDSDQDDVKDGDNEDSSSYDPLEDHEEEPKPKKLKKKFPHDHFIDAMASVPHMREKMMQR